MQLNCIFFFRFDVDTANVFSADLHVVPNRCALGICWGTGLQNEAASCVLSLSVEVWSVVLAQSSATIRMQPSIKKKRETDSLNFAHWSI